MDRIIQTIDGRLYDTSKSTLLGTGFSNFYCDGFYSFYSVFCADYMDHEHNCFYVIWDATPGMASIYRKIFLKPSKEAAMKMVDEIGIHSLPLPKEFNDYEQWRKVLNEIFTCV